MAEEFHVKGGAELQKFLNQLPVKIEGNVMRGALRAGAKPILKDAQENAPVGAPGGEGRRLYGHYEGALKESLRVSTSRRRALVQASIKLGGTTKGGADIFYWHFLEYTGAVAHPIFAPPGKSLNVAGVPRKSVRHPGMNARPFMRPALDNNHAAALREVALYIKNRLATKHGIDTRAVRLEGDE